MGKYYPQTKSVNIEKPRAYYVPFAEPIASLTTAHRVHLNYCDKNLKALSLYGVDKFNFVGDRLHFHSFNDRYSPAITLFAVDKRFLSTETMRTLIHRIEAHDAPVKGSISYRKTDCTAINN